MVVCSFEELSLVVCSFEELSLAVLYTGAGGLLIYDSRGMSRSFDPFWFSKQSNIFTQNFSRLCSYSDQMACVANLIKVSRLFVIKSWAMSSNLILTKESGPCVTKRSCAKRTSNWHQLLLVKFSDKINTIFLLLLIFSTILSTINLPYWKSLSWIHNMYPFFSSMKGKKWVYNHILSSSQYITKPSYNCVWFTFLVALLCRDLYSWIQ